jgi:amino acid transporter
MYFVIVSIVYVVVAVGTAMLIGAGEAVQHKEVALAIAGQKALGTAGLVIVTIAAAFSTGSAINATLFATARLAYKVAEDGELPAALDHKNKAGIPDRAVIGLGAASAVLAAVGTLSTLVEAASLAFLFTFAIVCGLAFLRRTGLRVVTGFGALAGITASTVLIFRLIRTNPIALVFFGSLVLIAFFGRPLLLRYVNSKSRHS